MNDLDAPVIVVQKDDISNEAEKVSLFEAARRWSDAEGAAAFEIEKDGTRLTSEQIDEITHSEAYKDRLLAFNDRR